MQLSRNMMFYVIILLIGIIIVGSVGFKFTKTKENFTSDAELLTECQMWDCSDSIPTKLSKFCNSRLDCACKCINRGAEMFSCPQYILDSC